MYVIDLEGVKVDNFQFLNSVQNDRKKLTNVKVKLSLTNVKVS